MNTRRANGVEETDSKFRDRTPPTRLHPHDVPTKQKSPSSPLRNKSGSPTRQYNLGASIDPNRVSTQEYLNQLVNDNESLQRRLNLVLQELDRVNRDRTQIEQKVSKFTPQRLPAGSSSSSALRPTGRGSPGMSLCTPAAEKEMKAKNVALLSTGIWALMPARWWRGY